MKIDLLYAELVQSGTVNLNALPVLDKLELLRLARIGAETMKLQQRAEASGLTGVSDIMSVIIEMALKEAQP
ncbi:hypothetical protein [Sporomusa aerivorans]|uniref:hypothetical protein n=1 Tax=Sporomusa aerivorans TaxID=204936 RepID=UPI00352B308E